jgi:plasmid stabilization system protein ParE
VTLAIHPAAVEEYLRYADFLDERRAGHGREFLLEIRSALQRIEDAPESFPLLETVEAGRPYRRVHVKRFQHLVVYEIVDGEPFVVTVSHGHRNPRHWFDRRR